jgi:hypothetical protein
MGLWSPLCAIICFVYIFVIREISSQILSWFASNHICHVMGKWTMFKHVCCWRPSYQEGSFGFPLTCLTPPYICACPKPGSGFQTSHVVVFSLCSVSSVKMIGHCSLCLILVDIPVAFNIMLIFLLSCVFLLWFFTFWVPCCPVCYDFRIAMMFGCSPPVVGKKVHVC